MPKQINSLKMNNFNGEQKKKQPAVIIKTIDKESLNNNYDNNNSRDINKSNREKDMRDQLMNSNTSNNFCKQCSCLINKEGQCNCSSNK